jgi:hypothetical protein
LGSGALAASSVLLEREWAIVSDVLGLVVVSAEDLSVYSYGFTFKVLREHCEFVLERMVVLLLLAI